MGPGSRLTLFTFVHLLVFFAFVVTSSHGKCDSRKNATAYAQQLLDSVIPRSLEPIRLPRRLLGDVYLKRGFITNLRNIQLGATPIYLVCYNDTVGAIQAKFRVNNVSFTYDWVMGDDEVWGQATIPGQTVYIDVDIQQMESRQYPNLLGLYTSDLTNTRFDVEIQGGRDKRNTDHFKHQIVLTTKTAILRDAKDTLSTHFLPKVEDYLYFHKIPLQ